MTDSTIRVSTVVKKKMCDLDFVGKEHSYESIIKELIEFYNDKSKIN